MSYGIEIYNSSSELLVDGESILYVMDQEIYIPSADIGSDAIAHVNIADRGARPLGIVNCVGSGYGYGHVEHVNNGRMDVHVSDAGWNYKLFVCYRFTDLFSSPPDSYGFSLYNSAGALIFASGIRSMRLLYQFSGTLQPVTTATHNWPDLGYSPVCFFRPSHKRHLYFNDYQNFAIFSFYHRAYTDHVDVAWTYGLWAAGNYPSGPMDYEIWVMGYL